MSPGADRNSWPLDRHYCRSPHLQNWRKWIEHFASYLAEEEAVLGIRQEDFERTYPSLPHVLISPPTSRHCLPKFSCDGMATWARSQPRLFGLRISLLLRNGLRLQQSRYPCNLNQINPMPQSPLAFEEIEAEVQRFEAAERKRLGLEPCPTPQWHDQKSSTI